MEDKPVVREFFTRLTGLFKNFNYAREDSPDYQRYLDEIRSLAKL
jgi:V/A-type H+-transporting ATPase subunit A